MSSYCEKDFPVCAEDIDVTVTNFNATLKERDYNHGGGQPPMDYIKAKVLANVAKVKVTQPLTDTITIPEGFYAIKNISRRLVLTQCYVVPNEIKPHYCANSYSNGGYDHNKCDAHLFVEGYILKNVEYATPSENQPPVDSCNSCVAMRNDYKDLTAKIEFSFSVPIELDGADFPVDIDKDEAAVLKDCMKPCDKGTMSESDCERFYTQSVHLQEPFKCELDNYKISEAVINKTSCTLTNPDLFDTIVEKLTLNFNISIFQLQVKKLQLHQYMPPAP